jgi:serine phosphatase RsbU (regulator of sigma subunit)
VTVAAQSPLVRAVVVAALLCVWVASSAAAAAKPPPGQTPTTAAAKPPAGQVSATAAGKPPAGQAPAAAGAEQGPDHTKPDRARASAFGRTSRRRRPGARARARPKARHPDGTRARGQPAGRARSVSRGRSGPRGGRGGSRFRHEVAASARRSSRGPRDGARGRLRGARPPREHAVRSKRPPHPARSQPGAAGGSGTARAAAAVPAPRSRRGPPAGRAARRAGRGRRDGAVRQGPTPTGTRPRKRARRPGTAAGGAAATAAVARRQSSEGGRRNARRREPAGAEPKPFEDELPQPLRAAREIVKVVPAPLRVALAALAALSIVLGGGYLLTLLHSRRLARQRRELLADVGALQAALLPAVAEPLPSVGASVAYRPADGPAAGGDFYDIVALADGRTAFIVGDVSGHGRAALGRAALSRYTLTAYLEAGLEPPEALATAGAVLASKLGDDFVTALIAVHDARAGTLSYATAGHPAPIVLANGGFEPVLAATRPPLGLGPGTGRRQTILPFPRGAVACLYTDGLPEAGTGDGRLGSARLERLVRELGPEPSAEQLIDRVAACAGTIADDAAACVIWAKESPGLLPPHTEQIELTRAELRGPLTRQFLEACGLTPSEIGAAERQARAVARRTGRAIVHARIGNRPGAEVRPPARPRDDETPALRRERLHIGA